MLQYIAIANDDARYNIYVANRVSLIQDNTDLSQWRHVRSKDNPADAWSKGNGYMLLNSYGTLRKVGRWRKHWAQCHRTIQGSGKRPQYCIGSSGEHWNTHPQTSLFLFFQTGWDCLKQWHGTSDWERFWCWLRKGERSSLHAQTGKSWG